LSSQYLSSLLLAAPYAAGEVTIRLQGSLASQPYVDITIDLMKTFGVRVVRQDEKTFTVASSQAYVATDYVVEGDASSATYFMAAAAICGGSVRIANIRKDSLQGDLRFCDILKTFGCIVQLSDGGLHVEGPLRNHQDREFDLGDVPDLVPALAVVSAFRRGKTRLGNIGHLRVKECDRISALATELRRIGATVEEKDDEMTVQGIARRGGDIACYNDHRIAMSFAVAGLAIDGISITDPDCVNKSFPDFWQTLQTLR
jgi:3-phosphoshikimate 1-carboxyvinyltransferase